MVISADNVKKLREMTGAGMMDAKQALTEANGDMNLAVEVLRKQGQKIAAKKSTRDVKEGYIGVYLHANGKIAASVELLCETDFVARNEEFQSLAKELAMQVAAMNPLYVYPEDVPDEVIAKEKDIYRAEMNNAGKPVAVVEKIIEGKLEKFYSQNCLSKQAYIKDDSISIEKLITDKIAKIGENIKLGKISRLSI